VIRIIIRTDDASMAANVGGSVNSTFRTFDIHCPSVEAFLSEKLPSLAHRQVLGIEQIGEAQKP
jgi:hypothetical protein